MQTIPLTRDKFTMVDDADYEALAKVRWYAKPVRATWYAARTVIGPNGRDTTELLHRVLLGAGTSVEVRHKDDDGLNNTRDNLLMVPRLAGAVSRRSGKTSGYRGVWKSRNHWIAMLTHQGTRHYLGHFPTAEAAAAAYAEANTRIRQGGAPPPTTGQRPAYVGLPLRARRSTASPKASCSA